MHFLIQRGKESIHVINSFMLLMLKTSCYAYLLNISLNLHTKMRVYIFPAVITKANTWLSSVRHKKDKRGATIADGK